ncbi:Hypp1027 [Branchiostoma lanceolatum]|uniref:Hypp1027 protein n=1 Tax=Branchiostoma lanceolatum TaxID=7740 RepID=A0A8J9ZFS7_BRALA|nr:Hypp1027 [Branchiostoma lanceolatum]
MDIDLSEVTFDDLGWDSFFPCHPEKGVDLSRIYESRQDPRRWQEEEGEQSSSEDEDVDPATQALPLKSYMISEVGGAQGSSTAATTEEPQWHCHDEGSLDDFDWDNYVPARLGRYKPTYAFVLTHGHNPSLYYDEDSSFNNNQFPTSRWLNFECKTGPRDQQQREQGKPPARKP